MKKDIGEHIISKLDLPDIVKILSDELSGSELNTILLEVFNRRIQQETPSSLLNKYEGNKLVKPANIDVLRYKEQELTCYKVLASRGFEPIEHSPAAQLGTSSVVATVDQKKVLTALRNTEMQADPTNATALHYASLKKNFTPHFSVICLISCGKDTGSFNFEKEELLKHLTASYDVLRSYSFEHIYFEIIPCKGYDGQSPLITESISYVQKNSDHIKVSVVEPDYENNYYYGFRIKAKIVVGENVIEIGDGGLLDWTQQLLTNRKERMMTMGIGFSVLHIITK